MFEAERKKILLVDFDLPHIHDIGSMIKKCEPNFFVDIRPAFSFVDFNPKDYDAIFVCSSYLEDCRVNLANIKNRKDSHELKIFLLFPESICPLQNEEYFRENGIDGFITLPFAKERLHHQLGY